MNINDNLNPQGDEYSKAAITLANKEIITDEGSKYLIYDIANNYGLDKLTRERKLAWFEDNKEMIIETGHKKLFKEEADKPLLFQKGCKAYLDYLEGKESGYICQMDATASFAQIMAVLSKDKNLAIITNLTDAPNRYDFYSEVIKEFLLVSKSNVDLKTARSYLKKALMVYFYNGEKEFNRVITKPENRKLFKEILQSVAKGAYEIRETINNVYLELSDRALFNYILPDNFQVSLPQIDTERVKVNSPFYNVTVQYDVNRPNVANNRRFLAPSFIHSIDAYIAREMIRRVDYDMLVNHDSFMSHPNNCEKSLEHYKDILNQINYSNLFDNLLSQMYGQKIESKFTNREPLNLIHRSTYALC
ncbi:TPA: hypothetical protein SFZ56_000523 [Campylobacter coli]|nr:hypothetical protein [Campylobacter coli]